ncbi:hypothetical protein [Alkalihalobacillus pseudalcaliphilus]|uniref:hypothetical protein n=1 Tax=Alkalihalobacillus pseudalcaliphilus TaxID=79884 RepID=UPI000B33EFFE|nr:hypothetical protein [Alkalihalobacillus pseudalcaliphilus]
MDWKNIIIDSEYYCMVINPIFISVTNVWMFILTVRLLFYMIDERCKREGNLDYICGIP